MKDFIAKIFEFGGSFLSIAADDLYEYVYTPMAWIILALTLLVALGYYKLFDRPRFHRWWHWGIVMGITTVVAVAIAIFYIISAFKEQGLEYGLTAYMEYLIAVALIAIVLFFLLSMIIKPFSINRTKTPF